jgi:TonB family protein
MPVNPYQERATFGLLPEPERRPGSFIASIVINGLIVALLLYIGTLAKKTLDQHRYQETLLVLPPKPTPPPPKVKLPPIPPPPVEPEVKLPEVKLEAPKIVRPKPEPKPDLKPIQMEAKLNAPVIKTGKPQIILAPQPKAALANAAMPAQDNHVKLSTAPVHFGQTFGATPNPNATRPATVAAIGNPYGGMQGPAVAPHGIVGSSGFGNGTKSGSSAGVVGKVASAGIRGAVAAPATATGRVASAGIPTAPTATVVQQRTVAGPASTGLEVISKPQPQYTSEAKQLKVQGDVILRVTFQANGQVIVQGVVHGLGHGLDEEARRVAQQIRFRPATRNGQPVDMTTNITITFQLA